MAAEDARSLSRKGVEVALMEGSPMILLNAGARPGRYVTMTTAETEELIKTLRQVMAIQSVAKEAARG